MAKSITMSAADITKKWQDKMKGSVSYIQAGVQAVQVSPMSQAVAKQDKMLTNLTAAISSGRWAKGMNKVSLQDWKDATSSKVAARLASGVDAATAKHNAFAAWLIPTVNAGMAKVASMPDQTLEDSVNRVRTMMTHMHDNAYKGKVS